VANDLAGLTARNRKTEAEGHVVQTTLKLLQKQLTGNARGARRLLVVFAELTFKGKVDALCLLLFAKLQAIAYDLRLAIAAMLARGKIALLDRALVRKTLGALQKKLGAFAAAKAADRSSITCQFFSPKMSGADRFTRWLRFVPVQTFLFYRSFTA
jgi:hypothetical protein